MTEVEQPPQNGIDLSAAEDDDTNKARPADIEQDMREMERRKRVEAIMGSKLFREELERIVESARESGGTSGLLQQLSDIVGIPASRVGSVYKASNCMVPINDIRGVESMGYGKGEKILRCKLAATFRLLDLYGWTQGLGAQITARLKVDQEYFLVNPYGMLYHEITASSLNKVDMQGNVIEAGTTNFGVNKSQFSLHSAVHAARPDIRCAIYIGCSAVVAISSLKSGLLPISKDACALGDIAVHAYTGSQLDSEERDRLVRNLGPIAKVLLLTNHGALCCGETIEEAFFAACHIVQACETQLKLLPVGLDNLVLIPEETRKAIYEQSRRPPEDLEKKFAALAADSSTAAAGADAGDIKEGEGVAAKVGAPKWRVGGAEFEALMRMLDNAGYRTGYIYRHPLIKSEPPKPKNDVELPPAVSSLGYLLEEEELFRQGIWKKGDLRKGGDRSKWLNSPNVYQKVEVLETGTPDPKKITKWVAEGSPTHSTPVRIEDPLQFVPAGTNPREFKRLQQQIKDNRRADKISAGPQSHILEGVTWDEANRMKDATVSSAGDHVVLMGAASKGIIQRGYQHNATVYKAPYAKNPFDNVTDDELNEYKRTIERKKKSIHGEYTDTDFSESEALHAGAQAKLKAAQSEPEDVLEHQVMRIETQQAPIPSQPEVVLSDASIDFIQGERSHTATNRRPPSGRDKQELPNNNKSQVNDQYNPNNNNTNDDVNNNDEIFNSQDANKENICHGDQNVQRKIQLMADLKRDQLFCRQREKFGGGSGSSDKEEPSPLPTGPNADEIKDYQAAIPLVGPLAVVPGGDSRCRLSTSESRPPIDLPPTANAVNYPPNVDYNDDDLVNPVAHSNPLLCGKKILDCIDGGEAGGSGNDGNDPQYNYCYDLHRRRRGPPMFDSPLPLYDEPNVDVTIADDFELDENIYKKSPLCCTPAVCENIFASIAKPRDNDLIFNIPYKAPVVQSSAPSASSVGGGPGPASQQGQGRAAADDIDSPVGSTGKRRRQQVTARGGGSHSPYRTVSHFGFNSPKNDPQPEHKHVPTAVAAERQSAFVPLRKSLSFEEIFSSPRYVDLCEHCFEKIVRYKPELLQMKMRLRNMIDCGGADEHRLPNEEMAAVDQDNCVASYTPMHELPRSQPSKGATLLRDAAGEPRAPPNSPAVVGLMLEPVPEIEEMDTSTDYDINCIKNNDSTATTNRTNSNFIEKIMRMNYSEESANVNFYAQTPGTVSSNISLEPMEDMTTAAAASTKANDVGGAAMRGLKIHMDNVDYTCVQYATERPQAASATGDATSDDRSVDVMEIWEFSDWLKPQNTASDDAVTSAGAVIEEIRTEDEERFLTGNDDRERLSATDLTSTTPVAAPRRSLLSREERCRRKLEFQELWEDHIGQIIYRRTRDTDTDDDLDDDMGDDEKTKDDNRSTVAGQEDEESNVEVIDLGGISVQAFSKRFEAPENYLFRDVPSQAHESDQSPPAKGAEADDGLPASDVEAGPFVSVEHKLPDNSAPYRRDGNDMQDPGNVVKTIDADELCEQFSEFMGWCKEEEENSKKMQSSVSQKPKEFINNDLDDTLTNESVVSADDVEKAEAQSSSGHSHATEILEGKDDTLTAVERPSDDNADRFEHVVEMHENSKIFDRDGSLICGPKNATFEMDDSKEILWDIVDSLPFEGEDEEYVEKESDNDADNDDDSASEFDEVERAILKKIKKSKLKKKEQIFGVIEKTIRNKLTPQRLESMVKSQLVEDSSESVKNATLMKASTPSKNDGEEDEASPFRGVSPISSTDDSEEKSSMRRSRSFSPFVVTSVTGESPTKTMMDVAKGLHKTTIPPHPKAEAMASDRTATRAIKMDSKRNFVLENIRNASLPRQHKVNRQQQGANPSAIFGKNPFSGDGSSADDETPKASCSSAATATAAAAIDTGVGVGVGSGVGGKGTVFSFQSKSVRGSPKLWVSLMMSPSHRKAKLMPLSQKRQKRNKAEQLQKLKTAAMILKKTLNEIEQSKNNETADAAVAAASAADAGGAAAAASVVSLRAPSPGCSGGVEAEIDSLGREINKLPERIASYQRKVDVLEEHVERCSHTMEECMAAQEELNRESSEWRENVILEQYAEQAQTFSLSDTDA